MSINDDIVISPIGAVHPRLGSAAGKVEGRSGGHSGAPQPQDDSADIGLSHGGQAAELLFSATMDQTARLTGIEPEPALRPESELPGISHSQHLLLGMVMLFERYGARHPGLSPDEARQAFAPLAREGLERGFLEACQVLAQLNALPPAAQAQLQGLRQMAAHLLDERFSQA
ncbi:DUF5610 domain-containing protein [Chromobacterium alticapitis]|uniref:DUF5610 domain-containing protein n=1 Tax=Chromobacterium alticapitis TaxID=2073169 RepID=A0A2S5DIA2_9NEIS|nr:DUF5610 domain-containing protein [Chromobacterium alticapitis]POZ62815.1 hypothetical protein C2I19_06585 [Chromobacterium alticapitis]